MLARLADSEEPVYGVSTGFGSLAGTWIPPERREELQRALIRSHAAGMGPPIEREAVRAMMFLRARSLAMGRSGARPVVADTMLALLAAGLDPVVPEYGSLGASGDLAPLAHCGLALIGEGEVWTAAGRARACRRGPRRRGHRAAHAHAEGGPRAHQRHGRDPRDAAARPPRPGPAAPDGGRDGGHVHGGAARHRPRLRRRPRGHAPPARPGAQRRQPHAAAGRLADRGEPPLRRPARAGRVLAALRAAGERGGPGHARARGERGRRGAALGHRQPGRAARRPRGVVRQLPRRSGGDGLRLPGDRGRRGRRDRRAAHRPHARSGPLVRSAAVPHRGRGRELRGDARPLHPGRDGGREPPPRRAREHRLAAHERDAGGPRVDGLGRGAQAAHRGREPGPHPGRGAHLRGAGARPSRPARAGARHGGRARRGAGGGSRPGTGPLAGAGARRGRGARGVGRRRSTRSRPRSGASSERADRPRPARRRAVLPGLGAGGRAADADEQPRPGRGGAARRAGGVRRHGQGRALLGGVRRPRPDAANARRTTRPCSSSRGSRSACSARTSGRRGC